MMRQIVILFALVCGNALAQGQAPQELVNLARSVRHPFLEPPSTRSGLPQLYTPGAVYLAGPPLRDGTDRLFQAYLVDATAGDPVAEASVSRFYLLGVGMKADPNEAFSWALKGAQHGNAIAALYTGHMYKEGTGTAKDFKRAAQWYLKASETLAAPSAEYSRKFLVQAEASVRDKQFLRAYQLLGQATSVAPWSPLAWYNLALVCREIAADPQYAPFYSRAAIDSMQMFLVLAPDSPQARAAQDLIYELELKAK